MSYIIGIALGMASIAFSLRFLNQTYHTYIDDVAILMVIGGTLSVGIVSMQWQNWRRVVDALWSVLINRSPSHNSVVSSGLFLIQNRHVEGIPSSMNSSVAHEILKDGAEMLNLDFTTDELQTILHERLQQSLNTRKESANYFIRLAKYPPAFGLVGTVFGLINLMRSLTDGMTPGETGVKMSLALIATLYGLLVSNFIVFPIGEAILKRSSLEKHHGEIAIQAVLLASEKTSLLKAQELLNSFVARRDRVDIIKSSLEQQASA